MSARKKTYTQTHTHTQTLSKNSKLSQIDTVDNVVGLHWALEFHKIKKKCCKLSMLNAIIQKKENTKSWMIRDLISLKNQITD